MAGNWIALDHDLSRKAEVLNIAASTGLTAAAVVGGLHAVWSWFDNQSCHGSVTVQRDTRALIVALDALACAQGFCEAMSNEGWLDIRERSLSIPEWDAHFSKSAKERCLAARRQRSHRAESCHASVTHDRDNTVTTGQDRTGQNRTGQNTTCVLSVSGQERSNGDSPPDLPDLNVADATADPDAEPTRRTGVTVDASTPDGRAEIVRRLGGDEQLQEQVRAISDRKAPEFVAIAERVRGNRHVRKKGPYMHAALIREGLLTKGAKP